MNDHYITFTVREFNGDDFLKLNMETMMNQLKFDLPWSKYFARIIEWELQQINSFPPVGAALEIKSKILDKSFAKINFVTV